MPRDKTPKREFRPSDIPFGMPVQQVKLTQPKTRVRRKVHGNETKVHAESRHALNEPSLLEVREWRDCMMELARRNLEAIRHYVPMPVQDRVHRSLARRRLAFGSNQSGKTASGSVDVAWAIIGRHPYIPFPKTNGRCYCVAQNMKDIGEVMWRKLSRPQFKLIRDENTQQWRCINPKSEYDNAYKEKWIDASPLLPERLIVDIAWHSKKEEQPAYIKLRNGWEVRFYSGDGRPQSGSDIDFAWLDEEIENELWIPELRARIIKRGGRILWTATPEHATDQMIKWWHQSKSPDVDPEDIEAFFFDIEKNDYFDDRKRELFKSGLSPMEYMTKYKGEFALSGHRVYPDFNIDMHCTAAFPIPSDWTRYMVVDPGTQVCAVLFAAVPPQDNKEWSGTTHIYDELHIKQNTAKIFGELVAGKMGDYRRGAFEAFIMDMKMGDQSHASGLTECEHYTHALEVNEVYSRATHHGFYPGSQDIRGRETSLRSWMEIQPGESKPRLVVHKEKCQHLINEIQDVYYVRNKKHEQHDKRIGRKNDLVNCAEYMAAFDPQYVKQKPATKRPSRIKQLLAKMDRQKRQKSQSIRLGPPER